MRLNQCLISRQRRNVNSKMGREFIALGSYKQGYPQKLGRGDSHDFSCTKSSKKPSNLTPVLLAGLRCWAYDPAPDHQTKAFMRNFVALSIIRQHGREASRMIRTTGVLQRGWRRAVVPERFGTENSSRDRDDSAASTAVHATDDAGQRRHDGSGRRPA